MIGRRSGDHAVAHELARRGLLVALVIGLIELLLPLCLQLAPGR